ncbi:hypothetical protein AzCIB_2328 [Azoarcus sp. CIB]|uniref:DUF6969 family protein n=1 Tax=Aromatoleum sp. (strain CIB) TaxID=198107 RepID=UPI0006A2EBAD|nr:hypothetical protein [Azoarcus sp. CIB]AKU12223.1 hypothetical protein AzCIB_2328 [Azoarcus sp. CIB]
MRRKESMRGEVSTADTAGNPTAPFPDEGAVELLTAPDLADYLPKLENLDRETRRALLQAGREVLECRRVLSKVGLNVVGEVLRDQGEFVEMEHYPRDDVFDAETHAQYYYHAHRGELEHGHFHTFLRAAGMPDGVCPLPFARATEAWSAGNEAISHLIAISMDAWGEPIGLFACNRWVTGETWYPAEDVIGMLDRFVIDHAWPSWPTNRWISAMLRLYRPWIEGLLWHRDAVIAAHPNARPDDDVFENRTLEITGLLPISVDRLLAALAESI